MTSQYKLPPVPKELLEDAQFPEDSSVQAMTPAERVVAEGVARRRRAKIASAQSTAQVQSLFAEPTLVGTVFNPFPSSDLTGPLPPAGPPASSSPSSWDDPEVLARVFKTFMREFRPEPQTISARPTRQVYRPPIQPSGYHAPPYQGLNPEDAASAQIQDYFSSQPDRGQPASVGEAVFVPFGSTLPEGQKVTLLNLSSPMQWLDKGTDYVEQATSFHPDTGLPLGTTLSFTDLGKAKMAQLEIENNRRMKHNQDVDAERRYNRETEERTFEAGQEDIQAQWQERYKAMLGENREANIAADNNALSAFNTWASAQSSAVQREENSRARAFNMAIQQGNWSEAAKQRAAVKESEQQRTRMELLLTLMQSPQALYMVRSGALTLVAKALGLDLPDVPDQTTKTPTLSPSEFAALPPSAQQQYLAQLTATSGLSPEDALRRMQPSMIRSVGTPVREVA